METSLTAQSPGIVFSKEEQIITFIQATYPNIDLSPGTALRDLVVKLYAHLETRIQEQIDLALISSSLLEISKNPGIADATQVERVLSNFNVTRGAGSTAGGTLRLFFSSGASVVISPDTNFTIGGLLFTPTSSYVLVLESSFTGGATQRILEPQGTLYSVTIQVTCKTAGSGGNIRASTVITKTSPSIATLVSGKADSDFTGGADVDDNATLLVKAKAGVVGKVFGGREHIKAKLKSQFSGVSDVGVVGFLDKEMDRDLLAGVHTGSRVDLYVKSANYPSRITEKVPVQMLSYQAATKTAIFELTLTTAQSSGLYSVESIRPSLEQLGGLTILSDIRTMVGNSLHFVGEGATPAFTAYQKVTIKFSASYERLKQAATPLALTYILTGTTQNPTPWPDTSELSSGMPAYLFLDLNPEIVDFFNFYVEYLKMPNLTEIQGYVDSAAERSLSADMLVKAPVPIMCSLQLRLLKPSGAEAPNLPNLKAALVSKFNSFEMGTSIPASALIHVAYQNIPTGYTVDLPIHMYGVIINPDLSKDVIYSSDALRPPNNPAKGATPNTCAFFLESNLTDISIVECA